MSAKENAMAAEWIDPDDAPELTDDFFAQADEYVGNTLIRRGRPKAENTTQVIQGSRFALIPDSVPTKAT